MDNLQTETKARKTTVGILAIALVLGGIAIVGFAAPAAAHTCNDNIVGGPAGQCGGCQTGTHQHSGLLGCSSWEILLE